MSGGCGGEGGGGGPGDDPSCFLSLRKKNKKQKPKSVYIARQAGQFAKRAAASLLMSKAWVWVWGWRRRGLSMCPVVCVAGGPLGVWGGRFLRPVTVPLSIGIECS